MPGKTRKDSKVKVLRKPSRAPKKALRVKHKKASPLILEGAKTLSNPFYGINRKLSEAPKTNFEFENKKYYG